MAPSWSPAHPEDTELVPRWGVDVGANSQLAASLESSNGSGKITAQWQANAPLLEPRKSWSMSGDVIESSIRPIVVVGQSPSWKYSMGNHKERIVDGVFGLSVICLVLLAGSCALGDGCGAGPDTILPTGREAAVATRLNDRPASKSARDLPNSMDEAMATLLARACPLPETLQLAQGGVMGLCEEFRNQTGQDIQASQQQEWARAVAASRSFQSVLETLRRRASLSNYDRLVEAGLKGMLAATGWRAATVLKGEQLASIMKIMAAREKPGEEPGLLGLKLDRWPVIEALPESPAAEAGMKTGDVILKINGRDMRDVAMPTVKKLLAGPAAQTVAATVRRGEKVLEFHVTRASAGALAVRSVRMDRDVVYVKVPTLEGPDIAEKAVRLIRKNSDGKASAIILDLRDNPGGRPEQAGAIADAFLETRTLYIWAFRNGKRTGFTSHPGAIGTALLVLLNRNTGSGAEMLAMALHDNGRATLIGEPTAGALFGKDMEKLKDGSAIIFRSEPTILSPTGQDYSIEGIPPDIHVSDELQNGRDAILAKALELTSQNKRLNKP